MNALEKHAETINSIRAAVVAGNVVLALADELLGVRKEIDDVRASLALAEVRPDAGCLGGAVLSVIDMATETSMELAETMDLVGNLRKQLSDTQLALGRAEGQVEGLTLRLAAIRSALHLDGLSDNVDEVGVIESLRSRLAALETKHGGPR